MIRPPKASGDEAHLSGMGFDFEARNRRPPRDRPEELDLVLAERPRVARHQVQDPAGPPADDQRDSQ